MDMTVNSNGKCIENIINLKILLELHHKEQGTRWTMDTASGYKLTWYTNVFFAKWGKCPKANYQIYSCKLTIN